MVLCNIQNCDSYNISHATSYVILSFLWSLYHLRAQGLFFCQAHKVPMSYMNLSTWAHIKLDSKAKIF